MAVLTVPLLARRCLAGFLAAVVALVPAALKGQESAGDQIKAAFLYKFGSYVEWPADAFADPAASFTVGVMGADDLARNFETVVASRTMAGRPVVVRSLQPQEAVAGVQMLFIGQQVDFAAAIGGASGLPVLVVTDASSGIPPGSMINFIIEDNKVRFDVDLAAAEGRNLKISSRLLSVARRVSPSS